MCSFLVLFFPNTFPPLWTSFQGREGWEIARFFFFHCQSSALLALPLVLPVMSGSHKVGHADCNTCWVLSLLPTCSWKQWARWPSLSCLVHSHWSIWTVHPVTMYVSREKAGGIRFELITGTPLDRSWNKQHLCTERACTCYAAWINHEAGSRRIPVDTKSQLTQLEHCSAPSSWSVWWKAVVPSTAGHRSGGQGSVLGSAASLLSEFGYTWGKINWSGYFISRTGYVGLQMSFLWY